MEKIKRNVSKPKAVQFAPAMKSEKINEVVNEVNNLKDKQVDLDGKLETMRLENEALWKEVMLIILHGLFLIRGIVKIQLVLPLTKIMNFI